MTLATPAIEDGAANPTLSTPEAIAEVGKRYGDICTRITLTLPENRDEERWARLFDSLRGTE